MQSFWERRRTVMSVAIALLLAGTALVVLRGPFVPQGREHATTAVVQAGTPAPTPTWHPTYTLTMLGSSPDVAVRAGAVLAFTWLPLREGTPSVGWPGSITCTLAFYGPFASSSEAQLATSQNNPALGPIASPPPLRLTRWTSTPQRVAVALPATLAPGYYLWVAATVNDRGEQRSDGVTFHVVG